MADPDRQIWDGMLSHLRKHHVGLCRQWFGELEPVGVSGGRMHIRTQTDVHRDYLCARGAEAFNDAALTVSGRLITVKFLGPDDEIETTPPIVQTIPQPVPQAPAQAPSAARSAASPTPPNSGAQLAQPASQLAFAPTPDPASNGTATHVPSVIVEPAPPRARPRRDDSLIINPDYSFENFIIGPGNRFAHAAAVGVSKEPGRNYNPLFIHGISGLGKTHLLQAICLRILEGAPDTNLYYISCESFVTQFIDAVQAGEMSEFRHRFRDVDVLVIDDIHFLTKRDRTQEEFFHTFNSLHQARKQIVLSSDAAPEEIPQLEERLVSRFKSGLVTKVEPPDFETRVAILKTKARVRGIDLPDDAASYIAGVIDRNIRELEGAITKLHIHATVENRAIDIDFVRAVVGAPAPAPGTGGPSMQTITSIVTEYFRVRLPDIQSKRRQRSIALPRQVAMFLARKHTRHSLEEIGGYFGGRDHTTVMHAIRAIEIRMTEDGDFERTIKSLEDKLRPVRAA